MLSDWPSNLNQLWLINETDVSSLQQNAKANYVFIDQWQIMDNTVQILASDLGMTYVLMKEHDKMLSPSNLRRIEWQMEEASIKTNLLTSENIRYC